MYKKTKNLLGLMLAFCMVTSTFLGNTISVDAETQTDGTIPLENIIISGFPQAKAGETMVNETALGLSLPENVKVYLEWEDENGNSATGKIMEEGHTYIATLEVDALANVVFADDFKFIINDTEHEPTTFIEHQGTSCGLLELKYDLRVKTITSAAITSIPSMELGASIADTKATFNVPEGCIAKSEWHIWDAAENEFLPVSTGTFTATDIYYLCITFNVADGYTFSDDFEIIVPNGYDSSYWIEYPESGTPVYHYDLPHASLAVLVNKIEIHTPEIKTGEKASNEDISVTLYSSDSTVPTDQFTVTPQWTCDLHQDEIIAGKAFESGHAYTLTLDITLAAGYRFDETLTTEHNGIINESSYDAPTKTSHIYQKSLLAPLEKVELTGLPEAKAGEKMSDSYTLESDLPENVHVSIDWLDENENSIMDETMEEGQIYTLMIEVYSSGLTSLSEDFVFVIDGVEHKPTYLDEHNDQPIETWLKLTYDIKKEVNDDQPNTPETNAPETNVPETNDTETKIPETNKTDNKQENPDAPQTGDASMILPSIAVAFISMCTMMFLFIRRKKL